MPFKACFQATPYPILETAYANGSLCTAVHLRNIPPLQGRCAASPRSLIDDRLDWPTFEPAFAFDCALNALGH